MVTLALIGIGKWGANYLKTAENMTGCQIKYIVSPDQISLDCYPDSYTKLSDYHKLSDFQDVDGIIVATPGTTHFQIVSDLLPSKIPLLVEKPLTTNLSDALKLKTMAEHKKAKIMVGHIYLYNPAILKVKELLAEIGRVRYMTFKGYNFGPFRNDMSALWEWAPHALSVSLMLMEKMPQFVSAVADEILRPGLSLCDNVYANLDFKDNIKCHLEFGWLYPFKRREIVVYGQKGAVIFNDLEEKKVQLIMGLGPVIESGNYVEQTSTMTYPNYLSISPLEAELNSFVDLIQIGKDTRTSINEAVEVISLIDTLERSISQEGKRIKIGNF